MCVLCGYLFVPWEENLHAGVHILILHTYYMNMIVAGGTNIQSLVVTYNVPKPELCHLQTATDLPPMLHHPQHTADLPLT